MTNFADLGRDGRTVLAIVDPIQAEGVEVLRAPGEGVALFKHGAEAARVWPRADGLVIRTSPLPKNLIAQCERLKVIGKHGVGVDNIDVAAATEAGIVVLNTPGANALAVAEGAIALMLAVVKR